MCLGSLACSSPGLHEKQELAHARCHCRALRTRRTHRCFMPGAERVGDELHTESQVLLLQERHLA